MPPRIINRNRNVCDYLYNRSTIRKGFYTTESCVMIITPVSPIFSLHWTRLSAIIRRLDYPPELHQPLFMRDVVGSRGFLSLEGFDGQLQQKFHWKRKKKNRTIIFQQKKNLILPNLICSAKNCFYKINYRDVPKKISIIFKISFECLFTKEGREGK